jgi:arginine N-succinyltransferase
MFVIRSARPRDLGQLHALAKHLDSYNLPDDRAELRALLRETKASFRGRLKPKDRMRFLFVAEDVRTRKLAGCSLIIARHGTRALPHLSLRVSREARTSRFLSKRIDHTVLKLSVDTAGSTEIGGLVVLPARRHLKDKVGKQLSYARFAYIARHPERFRRRVIVEYLPKFAPGGSGNALWEALGRKFTGLSYREADRLSTKSKEFILSLFPRGKIYGCFLPDAVVRGLGTPGPGARISLKMLSKIGFRFLGQIDPFDGGPHYGAAVSRISLVRKTKALEFAGLAKGAARRPSALVMAEKGGEARAVTSPFRKRGRGVFLPETAVKALGIRKGDTVTLTPFDV